MRTAHIVLGSILALTVAYGLPAQSDPPGEAKLSLSANGDALLLESEMPGSVYAIVAGLERVKIKLPRNLVLTVSPDLLLITGVLTDAGSARVPVDLVSEQFAGDEVHFQAAIWSFLPEDILPTLLTNRVTAVFRSATDDQDDPPSDDPGNSDKPEVEVVDLSSDFDPVVQLLSTDSIPPIYSIEVSAKVAGAANAEIEISSKRSELDPHFVIVDAHLIVKPTSDSQDKPARIVSAGHELGTKIRAIQVRFTSSVGDTAVPVVQ